MCLGINFLSYCQSQWLFSCQSTEFIEVLCQMDIYDIQGVSWDSITISRFLVTLVSGSAVPSTVFALALKFISNGSSFLFVKTNFPGNTWFVKVYKNKIIIYRHWTFLILTICLSISLPFWIVKYFHWLLQGSLMWLLCRVNLISIIRPGLNDEERKLGPAELQIWMLMFICIDINECTNATLDQCSSPELCTNINGSYTCGCPVGQIIGADQRKCQGIFIGDCDISCRK